MTIPVAIVTSSIVASAAFLLALVTAWGSINNRLGKLAAETIANRERSDMQYELEEERAIAREAAAEERALARHRELEARQTAAEERAIAREAAAEERALARHNEIIAEIRLWRRHDHDNDGSIFFRVPE